MRVLNIHAHPDDAEVHCGGTTALWTDRGDEVVYLVCTKGNHGTYDRRLDPEALAATRRVELAASARLLGVTAIHALDEEDGFLYPDLALRGRIMRVIRQVRPDVIFTLDPHLPYEVHPDHRTVGMLAAECAAFAGFPLFYPEHLNEGLEPHFVKEIYFYHTAEPNYRVPIDTVMDRKLAALYAHTSQVIMLGAQQKAVGLASGTDEEAGRVAYGNYIRGLAGKAGASAGCRYAETYKRFKVGAGHLKLE